MNTDIFKMSCKSFSALGLRQEHLREVKHVIPVDSRAFVHEIKAARVSSNWRLKEFLSDVDEYATAPTNLLLMTFMQLEDYSLDADDFFVSLTKCLAVLAKEGIAVIVRDSNLTVKNVRESVAIGSIRKTLFDSIGMSVVNTTDDEIRLFKRMLQVNQWSGFLPSVYSPLLDEADMLLSYFTDVPSMFRSIVQARLSGQNDEYKRLFLSLIRTLAHLGMSFEVKRSLLYFEQLTHKIPDINSISNADLEKLFVVTKDRSDAAASDIDLLSDFLQQAYDEFDMHYVAEILVDAVKYSSAIAKLEDTANALRVAMKSEMRNRYDR